MRKFSIITILLLVAACTNDGRTNEQICMEQEAMTYGACMWNLTR